MKVEDEKRDKKRDEKRERKKCLPDGESGVGPGTA